VKSATSDPWASFREASGAVEQPAAPVTVIVSAPAGEISIRDSHHGVIEVDDPRRADEEPALEFNHHV
jgi:hypothetical protein